MRTLLSLLAAGVVCGLLAPARGEPGQADPYFKLPIVAPGPRVKVWLHSTPGVPDFRALDVAVDSANLFGADALQLRKLLADARFFELKSSVVKEPPFIPDPSAVYTITVDMGGRKHTVSWNNGRTELQPLLNWLRARARQLEDRLVPLQVPARIIARPVPDGVSVVITGELSQVLEVDDVLEPAELKFPPRRPLPARVSGVVRVNGTTYRLNLGASPHLQNTVNKLNGRKVTVSGRLVGDFVQVAGLRAAAGNARPGVHVEIVGTLGDRVLTRLPPIPVWDITVSGKTYHLTLNSLALRVRATSLVGRRALVSGELQGGSVIVTDLFALPPLRC
jgi:hypothetical protein